MVRSTAVKTMGAMALSGGLWWTVGRDAPFWQGQKREVVVVNDWMGSYDAESFSQLCEWPRSMTNLWCTMKAEVWALP
jgi:hypothetical protein